METEARVVRRKRHRKKNGMKSRARSFGADLDELETERNIVFEIDDNKKRRTIQLTRDKGSWGFTIQTYGIKNKKTDEIEVFTFVDYVEVTGPAHKAGLRKGDIILSVNGQNVEFATHRELVEAIRATGEKIRMVVLFVDCCRKVELYDRLIKLKRLLVSKVREFRALEVQEGEILHDYGLAQGLDRSQHFRQSFMSAASSVSSWDDYSVLNAPESLLNLPNSATSHFRYDASYSSSSAKSSSNGDDDVSCFDDNFSDICYVDDSDADDDYDIIENGNRSRRGTIIKQDDANLVLFRDHDEDKERIRRDTLVANSGLFVFETSDESGADLAFLPTDRLDLSTNGQVNNSDACLSVSLHSETLENSSMFGVTHAVNGHSKFENDVQCFRQTADNANLEIQNNNAEIPNGIVLTTQASQITPTRSVLNNSAMDMNANCNISFIYDGDVHINNADEVTRL